MAFDVPVKGGMHSVTSGPFIVDDSVHVIVGAPGVKAPVKPVGVPLNVPTRREEMQIQTNTRYNKQKILKHKIYVETIDADPIVEQLAKMISDSGLFDDQIAATVSSLVCQRYFYIAPHFLNTLIGF